MATGTRSLPTNSPVPYFQPIERGHMLEGRLSNLGLQENIYVPPYVNPWEKTIRLGGTDYHPNTSEIEYLPILDWMIMTHCLPQDMVEEH